MPTKADLLRILHRIRELAQFGKEPCESCDQEERLEEIRLATHESPLVVPEAGSETDGD